MILTENVLTQNYYIIESKAVFSKSDFVCLSVRLCTNVYPGLIYTPIFFHVRREHEFVHVYRPILAVVYNHACSSPLVKGQYWPLFATYHAYSHKISSLCKSITRHKTFEDYTSKKPTGFNLWDGSPL